MKAVVDADAALIGFLAIITIFLMTSTQEERRRIPEKISQEDELHRHRIEKYQSDEREYQDYEEKIKRFSHYAERFSAFLDVTLFAALLSATFFVVSIFMALLGMSGDTLTSNIGVDGCISLIAFGITSMFYILVKYKELQTEYGKFELGP